MAALTAAFEAQHKDGLTQSYKIKASAKIWKGALVGVVGGYLAPMAHDTNSQTFVGVAYESVDNTGGSDGDKSCRVLKSGTYVVNAVSGYTAAQTDVGAEVYVNTDNEVQKVTTGLTNQYKPGTIVEFISTSKVRIRIDLYVK